MNESASDVPLSRLERDEILDQVKRARGPLSRRLLRQLAQLSSRHLKRLRKSQLIEGDRQIILGLIELKNEVNRSLGADMVTMNE